MKNLENYLKNCFSSRTVYGLVISLGNGNGTEIKLWDAVGNEQFNSKVIDIDCNEGHHCFKFENNSLEIL